MNYYESMIILKPELTQEQVEAESKKIADLVEKSNGKIIKTDYLGRRTLAYLIEKKREGYYIVNYLNLPPTEVVKIEKHYRLSENILRYNFLRRERKESVAPSQEAVIPKSVILPQDEAAVTETETPSSE